MEIRSVGGLGVKGVSGGCGWKSVVSCSHNNTRQLGLSKSMEEDRCDGTKRDLPDFGRTASLLYQVLQEFEGDVGQTRVPEGTEVLHRLLPCQPDLPFLCLEKGGHRQLFLLWIECHHSNP